MKINNKNLKFFRRKNQMAVKVAINGFGRIGRVALRIAINQPDTFKVCGINVRNADLGYMKYMIRYDSTFGRFQGELDIKEEK